MPLDRRIAVALERAARYRRMQAPPEWQGKRNLDELIEGHPRWQPVAVPDGWYDIGSVLDTLTPFSDALRVLWHPATDAVKVQRPRPAPKPAPPSPPPPPLRKTVSSWFAEPGYVYSFGGQDFPPDRAEVMVWKTGVSGWTWRRLPE